MESDNRNCQESELDAGTSDSIALVVTDLDPRNDENRPSLNSGAAAEERQDVSSQNTIDEMANAITGGNDIGL